ncbi:MAG: MraY family glycosyltransferase [Micrococcaceae bacterium]
MLIAIAITYICTPIARLFARHFDIYRPIRERDVHNKPMPRLGGVAMYIGLCFAVVMAGQMPFLTDILAVNSQVWGVVQAATILMVLGIADDVLDLDWTLKLGGQILAAAIMTIQGTQLTSLPIGGIVLGSSTMALVLTILVVVTCINIMNFVDGLDGLAAGICAIGGVAFFIYSYLFSRHATPDDYSNTATLIIAITIGICLGFLPHNFYKSKIFMGDTGAMLLGLLMAASAITLTGQVDPTVISQTESLPIFMPLLLPVAIIAVPLFDMISAIIRRTRAGMSPTSPDKMHLHHKMLNIGHSHVSAVLTLYTWTAVIAFGIVAFAFLPFWLVLIIDVAAVIGALHLTRNPKSIDKVAESVE